MRTQAVRYWCVVTASNHVRCEVVFTGRVQGVGFRYTTFRVAEQFEVSGWVRNEPDGSVRCVAEGNAAELDRFIAAINRAMQHNISNTQTTRLPATGEFSGFDIRR